MHPCWTKYAKLLTIDGLRER